MRILRKYHLFIFNVLKPYSAILFLNSTVAGAILVLMTFINPSVAVSGMIAVLFTVIFAELIGLKETYLAQGFYIYNSLLVGMGIGFLFIPSFVSVALIATSSAFTFILSFILNRLFSVYRIHILSLPFSIVSIFVYFASLNYSGLLSTMMNNKTIYDITLPVVLSSFLKSLGAIFFLPHNIAGILILLLMLFFSRIIFLMAVIGYYFGVMIHSFLIGSFENALNDPYAFNYILVMIALCGIFLLPTIKNFFLSLLGVAVAVILTDAIHTIFNYYGIPVFTLPFNFTVISFLFVLSMIFYKEFNYNIRSTPEESLSTYLSNIFRFGEIHTKISLPFSGTWSVYQAFNGEWTHKGQYRYAYDFVKKKEGKTYRGEGLLAQDYYAFGESVLSPVSGYVIDCRHDLMDNHIGEVDRINNWGNYIIIKNDLGFFIEISHLMQYSLAVKVGDYVSVNDIVAKCGNSGYSPEPHIHIQVQDLGVLGAFTREFCFNAYYQGNHILLNTLPKKNEVIESVIIDKNIKSRFIFILDDELSYDIYENEKKTGKVTFIVKMNELGEFYFEDNMDNRLYFYTDAMQFYFYHYEGKISYLKKLFILAPRILFINKKSVSFIDYLPVYLVKNRLQTIGIELASTINKNLYKIRQTYKYNNDSIYSQKGRVDIDFTYKGFSLIKYNTIELRRTH